LHLWGQVLSRKKIIFMCDNSAVVDIINGMTSKSDQIMVILRRITLLCLRLSIAIKACHLPGSTNNICDALSRLQVDKFRQLAPEADLFPHMIPEFLWQIWDEE